MSELKIVATIEIKDGFAEEFIKLAHEVVDATRKEEGCQFYELHQDINDPHKYTILEVWTSQAAVDAHNNSAHFKRFVDALEGHVIDINISLIRKEY